MCILKKSMDNIVRGTKVYAWDKYREIYTVGFYISKHHIGGQTQHKICTDENLQSRTHYFLNVERYSK